MYSVILFSRLGSAISLLLFLVITPMVTADSIGELFAASTLLCLFIDALISYRFDELSIKLPANKLVAALFQASVFSNPKATKGHKLSLTFLFGILFLAACVKLLGYW